jgi:hypothetical protein
MPPKISKEMLAKRRFPLKEPESVKTKSKMVQKEEKKMKLKLKYKK